MSTLLHDRWAAVWLQKEYACCSDAIFAVKSTVNYFVQRGSCVYAATLDLKKAFDSVNHFKMFSTLLDAGIPPPVVDVMCNWYSKLFAAVRWNSCLSLPFSVGSGVRQGSYHYHRHCSTCTLTSLSPRWNHVIVAAIYVTGFLAASCMPTILLF